jgi:predicted nucleic acid-binding protein
MRQIFVDTSAFLALANLKDRYHDQAGRVYREYLKDKTEFLTSDYVLAETYTLIRAKVNHRLAVDFGESLKTKHDIRLVKIDDTMLDRAWDIFKMYKDRTFSFVDCSSFALMEKKKIHEAFAFDVHFKQFGFRLIQDANNKDKDFIMA